MHTLEINGEGELTWKMTVKTECMCASSPKHYSGMFVRIKTILRHVILRLHRYLIAKNSITVFKIFRYRHFKFFAVKKQRRISR